MKQYGGCDISLTLSISELLSLFPLAQLDIAVWKNSCEQKCGFYPLTFCVKLDFPFAIEVNSGLYKKDNSLNFQLLRRINCF